MKPNGFFFVLVGFLACATIVLGGVTAWSVKEERRIARDLDTLENQYYASEKEWDLIRAQAIRAFEIQENASAK